MRVTDTKPNSALFMVLVPSIIQYTEDAMSVQWVVYTRCTFVWFVCLFVCLFVYLSVGLWNAPQTMLMWGCLSPYSLHLSLFICRSQILSLQMGFFFSLLFLFLASTLYFHKWPHKSTVGNTGKNEVNGSPLQIPKFGKTSFFFQEKKKANWFVV